MPTIGLMGFGRIGRNLLRLVYDRPDFTIGAISDIAPAEGLAYLLKYDSLLGRFPGRVEHTEDSFSIDGVKIPLLHEPDPGAIDWGELGVDIVVQATRKHRTAEWCQRHLDAGAEHVILASTPETLTEMPIVLHGVNEDELREGPAMVALGSNTSNALAPVLRILDSSFGVDNVMFTVVHGMTNLQRLADVPGDEFRASRAAGENIIPNETNSPAILEAVMPELAGKIQGLAMNVPVSDGSTIDTVIILENDATEEDVNDAIREATQGRLGRIIEYASDPIVSSDVIGTHSGVYDSLATMVIGGTMVKLLVWFDNGWGYASRVADTIETLGELS